METIHPFDNIFFAALNDKYLYDFQLYVHLFFFDKHD